MRADRMGREGQLHRRRGKAADAGFSLVELLIAVTILAIIVIPLLHLFVTSTRINVKSRQTLRATTVAQDIMEGLKAYTLEEVRTQFNGQDENGNFVLVSGKHYPEEGFYILNSDMIQDGVWEITGLEDWLDTATGKPKDPDSADNEIYYFGISDLKLQGGEYDALIRLDASGYTEAKVDAGGTGSHDNAFNGKYYADVMSVSETSGSAETDSSYHEPAGLYQDVLKDIKTKVEDDYNASGAALPEDWEEKWENTKLEDIVTKREILVEIGVAKKASGAPVTDKEGNARCQAKTTFTYTCKCPSGLALDPGKTYTSHGSAGGGGEVIAENTLRQFSSGNFYLFYYPLYTSGKVDEIKFEIDPADVGTIFGGEKPLLKSITLAKQIRSSVDTAANVIAPELTDAELYAKSSYKASVDISPAQAQVTDNLVYRTNIDTNMSKQARKTDPDGDIYWEDLPLGNIGNPDAAFQKADLIGDEVSDRVMNVIYDIEITVYEKGAAEHFGDPNFEDNEEVHRLAAITNLDRELP